MGTDAPAEFGPDPFDGSTGPPEVALQSGRVLVSYRAICLIRRADVEAMEG